LPEPGEEVEISGVRFAVLTVEDAQIRELRLLGTPDGARTAAHAEG
jgi:CBS domain containing-hemolysin-like protein